MMTSDTSERGETSENSNSNSTQDIENLNDDPQPVTLDMGNTVTVMTPDQEIESMERSRSKHPKWLVYTVVVLAVMAVAGIFALVTVSTHGKKSAAAANSNTQDQSTAHDPGMAVIADAPDNANNGAGGATDVTAATAVPATAVTKTPTQAPTAPLPATLAPSTKIGCLSDRLDNVNMAKNNRLYPGQYICSHDSDRRWHFGVSPGADLVFKDMELNSTRILFQNPYTPKGGTNNPLPSDSPFQYYFSLLTDGTFVMNMINSTNDEIFFLWTEKPKYKISLTKNCLPHHDCPYIHIHQGGTMVLNWIGLTTGNSLQVGGNDQWQNHNFLKVYNFSEEWLPHHI